MLQTDFIAVQNFLLYEQLIAASDVASDKTPGVQLPSVVASLDIGCDTTNVVVSSPQSLWFRSCGIAGQSFTRALVKEFQLSVAQAEQLKRAPESAERMSDLYATISPLFEDLTEEIQRLLASYAEAEPNRPIQRIFGLGGGFALHGLFRHLRGGR
jgi:Tfp pilus assembly PilM family ATPase